MNIFKKLFNKLSGKDARLKAELKLEQDARATARRVELVSRNIMKYSNSIPRIYSKHYPYDEIDEEEK